jgi:hypothetical protein
MDMQVPVQQSLSGPAGNPVFILRMTRDIAGSGFAKPAQPSTDGAAPLPVVDAIPRKYHYDSSADSLPAEPGFPSAARKVP